MTWPRRTPGRRAHEPEVGHLAQSEPPRLRDARPANACGSAGGVARTTRLNGSDDCNGTYRVSRAGAAFHAGTGAQTQVER